MKVTPLKMWQTNYEKHSKNVINQFNGHEHQWCHSIYHTLNSDAMSLKRILNTLAVHSVRVTEMNSIK